MIDWTQVLNALIANLPSTVTAAGAIVASVLAYRAGQKNTREIRFNTELTRQTKDAAVSNKTEAVKAITTASIVATEANEAAKHTKEMVERVEHSINGRMDELLEEAKKRAYAEGLAKGLADSAKPRDN